MESEDELLFKEKKEDREYLAMNPNCVLLPGTGKTSVLIYFLSGRNLTIEKTRLAEFCLCYDFAT